MRIAMVVLMAFVRVTLASCVTPPERIPLETRAEQISLMEEI